MSPQGIQVNVVRSVQDDELSRQSLEVAFQQFSQVSSQLVNSYEQLQNQVVGLQSELELSHKEKESAATEKDKLANRLDHLLDLLPGGVIVLDSNGQIEQCNPVAIDFLGAGLIGKSWLDVIQQTFRPRIDDGHEVSLRDGRKLSIATRSMNSTRDAGQRKGQIVLLTDQTQTRELQDRVSRHDRLSTMGKMVGYLAHQIRTPLSSAMLYGSHLKNSSLEPAQRLDFSVKLIRQLKSVEQQISDLLVFAKGEQAAQQELTIETFMLLLEREVEANANYANLKITFTLNMKTKILTCNPTALISAVLNLINNAQEAIGDSRINRELEIIIGAKVVNNILNLSVRDNGPGIEKNKINKVLEPFYSTKSKGTGLGLAVVQAVCKSLNGQLVIDAKGPIGLTVCLQIPLAI